MARKITPNGAKDMIIKIYGDEYDEKFIQILKDYAHKKAYIFPKGYLNKAKAPIHRNGEISFSHESKIFIKNLITLHILFNNNRALVVKIVTKDIQTKDLNKKMENLEKDLLIRSEVYDNALNNIIELKSKISEIDFKKQDIEIVINQNNNYRIIRNKKRTPTDIKYLRLIENIEQKSSYQDGNLDDMAEKALYFLKLGEAELSLELVEEILENDDKHNKALYIKAIIHFNGMLKSNSKALKHHIIAEEYSYAPLDSSEYANEMMLDDALNEYQSNKKKLFKILLKAYKYWPKEKKYSGELIDIDIETKLFIMVKLLELINRKYNNKYFKINVNKDDLSSNENIYLELVKEFWEHFGKLSIIIPFIKKNLLFEHLTQLLNISKELNKELYEEILNEIKKYILKEDNLFIKKKISFKEIRNNLLSSNIMEHLEVILSKNEHLNFIDYINNEVYIENIYADINASLNIYINIINQKSRLLNLNLNQGKFLNEKYDETTISKLFLFYKISKNILETIKSFNDKLKLNDSSNLTFIYYFILITNYKISLIYYKLGNISDSILTLYNMFKEHSEILMLVSKNPNSCFKIHEDLGYTYLNDIVYNHPILPIKMNYYNYSGEIFDYSNDLKEFIESFDDNIKNDFIKEYKFIKSKIDEYYALYKKEN